MLTKVRFGKVVSVKVLRRRHTDSGLAAFVDFDSLDGAVRAFNNSESFNGRMIRKDYNNPNRSAR